MQKLLDKNEVKININADDNVKKIAMGFYVTVAFVAFIKLILSFKSKV
jgi:hypothetical protein